MTITRPNSAFQENEDERLERPNRDVPAVIVGDAGKKYARHGWALSDVSMELYPGQVVGFIGPNGAGKTTLIKLLSGFIRATRGFIQVLGRDLTTKATSVDGIALVQESPSFIPHLSGRKNLSLLAGIRNVARGSDIEAALETVGLDSRNEKPVRTYSLGMRQRLGLAQALMERPQLLLLDEPTNGLDPQGIIELRALIRRLASEGTAVFLASHLLTEVEHVCDLVLLVKDGQVHKQIDRHQPDTALVHLTLSSPEDVESIRHWAGAKGLPVDPVAGAPLSTYIPTSQPVPEIVRELVEAGINIEAIARARRSLEQEFMELTGGQQS